VSSSGLAQRNFKQGAIGGMRICGLFEHGTLLKILCNIGSYNPPLLLK
jgi:hypothetical protein